MGSLLPGWDERAPGVAPKEFQDFNENEDENQGYFAAYAQMKKSQKEAGEPASPIAIGQRTASLARRSLSMTSRRSQDTADARLSPSSSVPMTPPGMRTLARAETMAPGADFRTGSMTVGSAGPRTLLRRYSMPATRGERFDVLAGLVPSSPSVQSSGTPKSLDAYKTQQADKDKPDYQWWRHLDSAAMNERPDEPVVKETGYKPQFGVTGQALHFRQDTDDHHGPPVIPAH